MVTEAGFQSAAARGEPDPIGVSMALEWGKCFNPQASREPSILIYPMAIIRFARSFQSAGSSEEPDRLQKYKNFDLSW